jgi:hypothetical protein
MAFTIVTQGTFTSSGVGVKIPLPSSVDYFRVQNLTQLSTTQATGRGVMFEWYGNGLVAADNAIEWKKTNSTDALNMVLATSGGFTYVTSSPVVEAQAPNAITAITAANPAVVSQTNSYSNGDIIRIYNTTGDLTISGMDFQISSVSGAGYTLLGLANIAGNGLSAATAGYTRRISKYAAVEPEFLYITNISQATQAVVSTSVDPSAYYVVGMKIHFSVPASFGMTQMNGLTGKIVAVNAASASGNIGAYNLTVDIDSSAFTAFAFPLTTSSPTAQLFATLAPAGASTQYNPITGVQTGYDFQKQPFRTGQFTPYMFLASGAQSPAGSTGDVIVWQAFKMETGTISSATP